MLFFLQQNDTILSQHDFLPDKKEGDNKVNIFKSLPGVHHVNQGFIEGIIFSKKISDFPYKSFDHTIDE